MIFALAGLINIGCTKAASNDSSDNAAPIIANAIADQTTTLNALYSFAFATNTFTDEDSDTLTYTATLDDDADLPAWLDFIAEERAFIGTPNTEQAITINVTADDGNSHEITDTFILNVTLTGTANAAPVVANAIADQSVTVNSALNFVFAANTFIDTDQDDLTYTAKQADGSDLPTWLTFTASTRTFSGTPTTTDNITVNVTANDGNSHQVSDSFVIIINAELLNESAGHETSTFSSLDTPVISTTYPDSLTGGTGTTGTQSLRMPFKIAAIAPMTFEGPDNDDFIDSGQDTTKFLVAMYANFSQVVDFILTQLAETPLPTENTMTAIINENTYVPEHLKYEVDGDTKTIKLYYTANSPDEAAPDLYLAWETVSGTTTGKLVLNSTVIDLAGITDSPTDARMDFTFTDTERTTDIFMKMPDTGTFSYLKGMRIQATKSNDDEYTIKGTLDLRSQPVPAGNPLRSITPIPSGNIYATCNSDGYGAAKFFVDNMLFVLPDSTMGIYLGDISKTEIFDTVTSPKWKNVNFEKLVYKGFLLADIPTQTEYENALHLSTGYFSNLEIDDETTQLTVSLNLSPDTGTATTDTLSTTIQAIDKSDLLSSPYPGTETSWDNVFTLSFD